MNGNSIIIKKNNTAIAGVKSQEVQSRANTHEVASSTQQAWEEYMPGRKNWSVNVNYLITTVSQISDVLTVGDTVTLEWCDRAGTVTMTGTAIVEQCKQTFTRGALVGGSFAFKGSGAISQATSS